MWIIMFCSKCGHNLAGIKVAFCPKCGAKQITQIIDADQEVIKSSSSSVATKKQLAFNNSIKWKQHIITVVGILAILSILVFISFSSPTSTSVIQAPTSAVAVPVPQTEIMAPPQQSLYNSEAYEEVVDENEELVLSDLELDNTTFVQMFESGQIDKRTDLLGNWVGTFDSGNRVWGLELLVRRFGNDYQATVLYFDDVHARTNLIAHYLADIQFNQSYNRFELTYNHAYLRPRGWSDDVVLYGIIDGNVFSGYFSTVGTAMLTRIVQSQESEEVILRFWYDTSVIEVNGTQIDTGIVTEWNDFVSHVPLRTITDVFGGTIIWDYVSQHMAVSRGNSQFAFTMSQDEYGSYRTDLFELAERGGAFVRDNEIFIASMFLRDNETFALEMLTSHNAGTHANDTIATFKPWIEFRGNVQE